jgi:hypothetical protein
VTATAAETAWYVYGVVSATAAGTLGAPVVEDGDLAAVVEAVPLSEFGEDALPERLNDRGWLEQHVQAHQGVLQGVLAAAAVVPFRFGTIYRRQDDVRAMLRERRKELVASLERVAGKVELGVKAWAQPAGADSAPASHESGQAYLRQQLAARRSTESATASLAGAAAEAHARLLRHAVEGVANRPQPAELTGRRERMVLNGAYLVADEAPLRAEVEALAGDAAAGLTFEVTGPWPPYNFVDHGEAS